MEWTFFWKGFFAALGAGLGLLVVIYFAFLVDAIDNRVRTIIAAFGWYMRFQKPGPPPSQD